jgi:hypothetical protein
MKVNGLVRIDEDVGGAVAVGEIEVENEGSFDLPLGDQFLDSDGDVVEMAEAPARMRAGVVSRRPDEAESGFALDSGLRRQDRPARRQTGDFVERRIPSDLLKMRSAVNPGQVSFGGGFGFDEIVFSLQGLDHRLHSPPRHRRVGGIDFVKPVVEDDLHRLLLRRFDQWVFDRREMIAEVKL